MPFQKGNQLAKNSTNHRRDSTVELVMQLNELTKNYDGTKRRTRRFSSAGTNRRKLNKINEIEHVVHRR